MSMIQPATVPAAAKLLLAIDGQADNGEATSPDARFSALLAGNFTAPAELSPGKTEVAPALELPFKSQFRPASDKVGGKLPGKLLPDSPALAAFAAMLRDLRGTGRAKGEAMAETADEAGTAASDPAAQLPAQPAGQLTEQTPAQALALPASADSAPVPTMPLAVAETAKGAAGAASQIRPAVIPLQQRVSPALAQPASVNPAQFERLAFLDHASTGPAGTGQAPPATPERAASEAPQSRPDTLPLVIQSGLTTRVVMVPRSQPHSAELAKLETMAIEQAKTGEAGAQIAKVQVMQLPEDRAARTVAALPPASATTGIETPEPTRARALATGNAEAAQETPCAALAQLDASPLFATDPLATPDAGPAFATSPAPAAAPSRTPDFAALIDRLVEARAAARATLEPHTVNAAIQHAEFGEVSLQFRQDAAGLSVAMTSADPDLAKALQVAAPGGGSFAGQFSNGGEGNAPQWRQDTSGQPAGSPSSGNIGQPQSQTPQQRGQSPQRAPDQAFGAANPSPRSRSQTDQAARSGIFA
jgi:hypothetical protein